MSPKPKRLDRDAVDLGVYPEPFTYKPPAAHICTTRTYDLHIDDDNQLKVRMVRYRGRVVDFSIEQLTAGGARVARIDCSGGTIHRHQFVASSNEDVYDHRAIIVIPERNSWDVVHDYHDRCLDVMMAEWEANLERWRDG